MAVERNPKPSNSRRSCGMLSFPKFLWMVGLLLLLSSSRTILVEASAPVPDADETAKKASETESAKKPPRNARFVHKTIIIPHDQKKFRGGEDAASTTGEILVVADGVGGWANKGVNPGLYSRKLTETITSTFSKLSPSEQDTVNLKSLVHKSNHAAAEQHLGSATCTVVRLKDASTLETVNIGDSGYSIHRRVPKKTDDGEPEGGSPDKKELDASDLEVVYASVPGQKGFNFPYQLGGQYGDQVYDENVTDGPNTHDLQDNDVIVVVSDGVIDNIDPSEYHACISKYQWSKSLNTPTTSLVNTHLKGYFDENELVSYSAVADCIARKAYFLGKDKTHNSPFAKSAARYGKRFLGGKHDDITVTVAQVERAVYDEEKGGDVFLVNLEEDDPHKKESIFVYKDSDGPIEDSSTMFTMDEILRGILDKSDVDPTIETSSGEL